MRLDEKWSGRWLAFPCGEKRTLLKLEMYCEVGIPLPARVVNKWLLWACRKGVTAVRDMAERGAALAGEDRVTAARVAATRRALAGAAGLHFDDRSDFERASRGLLARYDDFVIMGPLGRPMWDRPSFDFVQGECPPTVNPSLWRQAQLNQHHGLFEVMDGAPRSATAVALEPSEVPPAPGREVVEPNNVLIELEQGLQEVGADEPRHPGDQPRARLSA